MEQNLNFAANVGPGFIDKIEIQDTEYQRTVNGVATTVQSKVYAFYLKGGENKKSTCEPSVFVALERQHAGLIEDYKNLRTETINGVVTITGEAIENAECPDNLKNRLIEKDVDGVKTIVYKDLDGDGSEYKSYGDCLRRLQTAGAWGQTKEVNGQETWIPPKRGARAIATASMPISDGIQQFYRMKKGEIRKHEDGTPIVATTAKVAILVDWNPITKQWGNDDGGTPETALRGQLDSQIRNGLWRLKELPKTFEDIVAQNKGTTTTAPRQANEQEAPGAQAPAAQ